MRMPLLFGVKTVVDSNRGRLETCRGKSAMPLLEADKGMALFPQPQLLQGYANADLQKLNAARWFCFNPRRPARRQANPPYLLPAYTLTSRARKSLENALDPIDDPNADRSGKHRTVCRVCPKFCVNTAGQCKTEQKFFKAGAAPAAAALSTK